MGPLGVSESFELTLWYRTWECVRFPSSWPLARPDSVGTHWPPPGLPPALSVCVRPRSLSGLLIPRLRPLKTTAAVELLIVLSVFNSYFENKVKKISSSFPLKKETPFFQMSWGKRRCVFIAVNRRHVIHSSLESCLLGKLERWTTALETVLSFDL